MILFLGYARNLGHKCKGFLEIGKLKPLAERTINFFPRFSHPPTLDGAKDGQLVEWGVARNSAVLAGIKRRPLACTSFGEFRRQCRAHMATSVKTAT